ncbi:hypothetical protein [uncultured Draconibacterium sp.]|uniref:hypothetical protein n=1 Tax=uncultured Draconibacterium sp. TaxID=1573823 RepID=UPI00321795CA
MIAIVTLLTSAIHTSGQEQFLPFDSLSLYSPSSDIINGEEWSYIKKNVGHPFFINDSWNIADVSYNGNQYNGVSVKYNIETDELVVFMKENDRALTFKLNKQFLNSFVFYHPVSKNKIAFEYSSLKKDEPKFIYTKAFEGKLEYFIRYQKYINSKVSGNYTGEYLERAQMFLKIDDKLYELQTRNDFYALFENEKNEIKKYMRKNHIKFDRKNPEIFTDVIRFTDSLIIPAH